MLFRSVAGMSHDGMRDLLRDTLMPLMFVDFDQWHDHAIVHYKDYAKNDIIAPSCEKPHAHIALQKQGTNIRIGTVFKWLENLCDITVRPEDLTMLQNEQKDVHHRQKTTCDRQNQAAHGKPSHNGPQGHQTWCT